MIGHLFAVQPKLANALAGAAFVDHFDFVDVSTESAHTGDFLPTGRDTGINDKTIMLRMESQHILGNRTVHPAGGAGNPGEGSFALSGILGT